MERAQLDQISKDLFGQSLLLDDSTCITHLKVDDSITIKVTSSYISVGKQTDTFQSLIDSCDVPKSEYSSLINALEIACQQFACLQEKFEKPVSSNFVLRGEIEPKYHLVLSNSSDR